MNPELEKCYAAYKKADAAFNKWWNPDRRLRERYPKNNELYAALHNLCDTYRKVYGKPIPNGWASMTEEQLFPDPQSSNARPTSISSRKTNMTFSPQGIDNTTRILL